MTVNESTRIKPLSIAVKAKLLGQEARRVIGNLERNQSFSLHILDEGINRSLKQARSIADAIDALSFPFGKNHHWLPMAAKPLLEKEVEARNARGKELLKEALDGDVDAYIKARTDAIRNDLNTMYNELGRGRAVPSAVFDSILKEAHDRLKDALDRDIAPQPVYNRISAPRLTSAEKDDAWDQPLSLLLCAATRFRKLLTDQYERRRFSKMAFTVKEFKSACNMFEDTILTKQDYLRAERELAQIKTLRKADSTAREKCKALREIAQRTTE